MARQYCPSAKKCDSHCYENGGSDTEKYKFAQNAIERVGNEIVLPCSKRILERNRGDSREMLRNLKNV